MKGRFFDVRLEGMRGVAALVVAVHHGLSAFRIDDVSTAYATMSWAINYFHPTSAVFFFFVLSGYVLGLSLQRDGNVWRFLIRRVFRLVPIFLVTLAFAYLCLRAIPPDIGPLTSAFYKTVFWPPVGPSDLWANITFASTRVNGPSWSIYYEIIGSLILPALVLLHAKCDPKHRWLLFAVALAVLSYFPVISLTLRIGLWFYIGFFLPGEIAAAIGRRRMVAVLVFVAGFLLLWYIGRNGVTISRRSIVPTAIGGALMIGAVVSSDGFGRGWLDARPIRFLGRVSFSFYLVHWPIFYVVTAAMLLMPNAFPYGEAGNLLAMAVSVSAALLLAWPFYQFVERPFIDIGRKVAAHLTASSKPATLAP